MRKKQTDGTMRYLRVTYSIGELGANRNTSAATDIMEWVKLVEIAESPKVRTSPMVLLISCHGVASPVRERYEALQNGVGWQFSCLAIRHDSYELLSGGRLGQ